MVNIKPTTIFSKFPFSHSGKTEKDKEKRKASYWMEKLHLQREQTRKDENRREDKQLASKKDSSLAQAGINENTINTATKKEVDTQTLNDLVKKSNRCIISISSTFPWDLFPTTIEVEESEVIFKFNQFFSAQTYNVDIKDISNVYLETSILFATIQIVSRTYIQNDIKVGRLNKTKAIEVKRIIEGLRVFVENKINTSDYEIDELISKIDELHTHNEAS